MGRYVILILSFSFLVVNLVMSQSEAHNFKLDYEVPESPAFSIVDANPSTVMRGSSAKELAVNIASNFISSNKQETGIALDFTPYFAFGGRMKNIQEYNSSYFKRLLANTQFSFASIASIDHPDDNLISSGIRFTLYDDFDLLSDPDLGNDISIVLSNTGTPPPKPASSTSPPGTIPQQYQLVNINGLSEAYARAEERVKNKVGSALSLGFAIAQRAKSGVLSRDSLVSYRNQVWLSGQYNLGKGINILGLGMYRNSMNIDADNVSEYILGLALRQNRDHVNIGAEIVYSSEQMRVNFNANIEVRYIDNILFALSIGNEEDELIDGNRLFIKPTLKYNLSN